MYFIKKCIKLLKEYLFVGGMPEAVKLASENELGEIPRIHEQIVETYKNDFVKYTKKNHLVKIQKVFQHIYLNP